MLSELIDNYSKLKTERADLAKRDAEIGGELAKLEKAIIEMMSAAGTTQAASPSGHTVKIAPKTVPAVTDWPEFYKHMTETQNFEFLQKRLSAPAFRDRWAEGVVVPGVTAVTLQGISFTKARS